jgi:hypothetical protein
MFASLEDANFMMREWPNKPATSTTGSVLWFAFGHHESDVPEPDR